MIMMKIFRKFTRRSLAKNKMKTIVTIIGIVLSVSLFTAVAEGLVSALNYGMSIEKKTGGAYEVMFENVDASVVSDINDNKLTKSKSLANVVGFADIGSENEAKPYVYIISADENFAEMAGVRLSKGRLPENGSEIALPDHLLTNGNVSYNLGDKLELYVGKRQADGIELTKTQAYIEGETLCDTVLHSYTVVGFYERLDFSIENYDCPGYTAITCQDKEAVNEKDFFGEVYVTLKQPKKMAEYTSDILPDGENGNIKEHTSLLMFYGYTNDSGLFHILYGFAGILFVLILFGSISLIYNSFSISVSERTKQFGLLKSIGATRAQIMGTVLYEAVFLSVIAIPAGLIIGCAGIGTALYFLRDSFGVIVSGDTGMGVDMCLYIKPFVLLIVAGVGFITTIISAMAPAVRAMRIFPIDSIRQSYDIKADKRKIRTPKYVYKFFGFEGMLASKNYKRSRKKYRVTVISLFVSVVLFISASAFSNYLVKTSDIMSENQPYDIQFLFCGYDGDFDMDLLMERFCSIEDVNSLRRFVSYNTKVTLNDNEIAMKVCFVDYKTYMEIAEENGISIPDDGRYYGLLQDEYSNITQNEDGTVWSREHVFDDKEAADIQYQYIKDIPGYTYMYSDEDYDDEGNVVNETYYYCNSDNISDDESEFTAFSSDEACAEGSLSIAGKIDYANRVYPAEPSVIFPDEAMEALLPEALSDSKYLEYYFKVNEDNNVYEEASQIIDELCTDSFAGYSDLTDTKKTQSAMVKVINVFAFGFIILISLIALANVFNTMSTNIMLRRREFAMLASVGMSNHGMKRMMNYECVLYGLKGLIYGIPVSILVSFLLYNIISDGVTLSFYIPWYSVCVSAASVFVVVFATMLYSVNKIKKDNTIDALKNENI